MTDRARDITGQTPQPGRDTPPGEDDFTPPDQATDPHTRTDDTTDSLREKLTKNKFRLIGLSFIITAGLGFIAFLVITVAPGLLTDPLFQGAVALTAFTVLVFSLGGRRWLSIISNHTLMVEARPNAPKVWLMDYDRATNTGRPIKGVSLWRGAKANYSVSDLGSKHAQHIEKYGGDPEDEAVIKYPPSTKVADTWFARVGVCLTRGHRPTGGRQDVHLVAKSARRGHEEDLEDYAQELEQRDQQLEEKEDELQAVKSNRDKYKRLYEQEREDIREEIQEDMVIAHDAVRGDRRRGDRDDARQQDNVERLEALADDSRYGGDR
jgi:hypothetical protein